ncbi:MAG: DUF2934 domain-containing protein [Vicinamibacterales bacterium]
MIERRRLGQFSKRSPIQDAIATYAYERFLARGREHGHDLDDWLAAEQEFALRQSAPAVRRRTTGRADTPPP